MLDFFKVSFSVSFFGWGLGCIHVNLINNFLSVFSYGSICSCLCWCKDEITDFSVINRKQNHTFVVFSFSFSLTSTHAPMNVLYATTFYAKSLMQNLSFFSSCSRMESLLDCKK